MLLKEKNGIVCDFCGVIYKNQFVYFSIKTSITKVLNGMRISEKTAKFEKDCCEGCYNSMREQCLEHIGSFKHKTVKCDFSDQYLSGTFEYYTLYFDQVEVDKEQPEEQQVVVDKKVLDLNLSKPKFDELKIKTDKISSKYSEEQWS